MDDLIYLRSLWPMYLECALFKEPWRHFRHFAAHQGPLFLVFDCREKEQWWLKGGELGISPEPSSRSPFLSPCLCHNAHTPRKEGLSSTPQT